MPLHRIYAPPGLYSDDEKAALAEAITRTYLLVPAFYVVVIFVDIPAGSYFVGGKPAERFVRFTIEHFARNFEEEEKRRFMDRYEAALKPFTQDKGINWEINAANADRIAWNLNGIPPPPADSAAEHLWRTENKAIPYDLEGVSYE
ncbi:putative oxalocrotonate tautomerase [Mycena floridula]|nr:putative oxalocrotonate tautomerase [Mycena floridula]